MANDQEINIKVSAETSKAVTQINNLTKEIDRLSKNGKSISNSTKEVDALNKSFAATANTVKVLVAAYASIEGVKFAFNFMQDAAKEQQATDVFARMITDLGKNVEEEFNKMREASRGLLDDDALTQLATKAMAMGVPLEALAGLFALSGAKAKEMGKDITSVFEPLAEGIGKTSAKASKSIGITIDLKQAYIDYAATLGISVDALTQQEKAQAYANATIEAGADSISSWNKEVLSSTEKMQKTEARFNNLVDVIETALLPAFDDLITATMNYMESIDKADIETFIDGLKRVGSAMAYLNDIALPDWLVGQEMGLFEAAGKSALYYSMKLEELVAKVNRVISAMQAIPEVNPLVKAADAAALAVKDFDGLASSYQKNADNLTKLMAEAQRLKAAFQNNGSPEAKAQIEALDKAIDVIMQSSIELAKQKPFEATTESAKKAAIEEEKLAILSKKYSKERLASILELTKKEIDSSNKKITTLTQNETKLVSDIAKLHQDLANKIASLENERFNRNQDISNKLRDLQIGEMSELDAYYATQKAAEKALSDAKQALREGDLEKYRTHIADYESLVTQYANTAVEKEGVVLVTREETAAATKKGLENIQTTENQYYDAKIAKEKEIHDQAVAQKQLELDAVKIQIEAQRQLLVEMGKLSGVKVDVSAFDKIIQKVDLLKQKVALTNGTPIDIKANSAQIDGINAKITAIDAKQARVTVNADTSPAEEATRGVISDAESEEIYLKVMADLEKARGDTQALTDEISNTGAALPVDADTSAADTSINTMQENGSKPITADATLKPNTSANDSARIAAAKPIYVAVYYVPKNSPSGGVAAAGGGHIPERLAGGGTFKGYGRVHGYDPTDSDKVNAYLTGGEEVTRRKAVQFYNRKYGHSFFKSINDMTFGGFSNGGSVGTSSSPMADARPVNININGNTMSAFMTPRQIEAALAYSLQNYGGK